jgi:hypothetical protein
VFLITTGTGDKDGSEITETQLDAVKEMANNNNSKVDEDVIEDIDEDDDNDNKNKKTKETLIWKNYNNNNQNILRNNFLVGPRFFLNLGQSVVDLAWHYKGDYFAVLTTKEDSTAVSIHQVYKNNN